MYSNIINKRFFKENEIEELTVQQFVYVQIDIPELVDIADEYVKKIINRGEQERLEIIKEEDPDKIIRYLRGKCDNINHIILHKKVLENEEQFLPKIINMIKNTGNDVFIEHASKIIAKCKNNYSKELLEFIDEIRYPYALSLICITLGFIGEEDVIPVMYNKYLDLKKLYPNESYNQGPLLALYKLADRFGY